MTGSRVSLGNNGLKPRFGVYRRIGIAKRNWSAGWEIESWLMRGFRELGRNPDWSVPQGIYGKGFRQTSAIKWDRSNIFAGCE